MTGSDLLPPEFFERERPSAGDRQVGIVLGGLSLALHGLDAEIAGQLFEQYAPYSVGEVEAADALQVRLGVEGTDYFIQPPTTPQNADVRLAYDTDRNRVYYLSYRVAGWFDADAGRGEALLSSGQLEPAARALENYIRSAVAWQAASRGGALVHAASAVLRGCGYLFYGESGAGKSTLSACNTRASIVSDDLSLLLPMPAPEGDGTTRLHLVGSPFRGTYTDGEPVVGSFPLAAGFRIVQAPRAEVQPVPRLRAMSEFIGNMPFVAEFFGARPDIFQRIETALGAIPLAHLHFRKDDSYWDAIARWESS